jgi:DNA invertase Pin-like site-specific DNA recombinase
MHLTDEHLDEAYRSLVRAQITGGYRIRRSRREKIDDLLAQGLTAIQVQERLKISKSTYYRLMSDGATKIANAIARDFIKEFNRPQ